MERQVKKVLLLGAGMVSDPLAHYYSQQPAVELTVATESPKDGQRLAAIGDNIRAVVVDVNKEPEVIDTLIGCNDLCVTLLPYTLHLPIVKMCIGNKKNMVTSSYITPELQALDEEAKRAGITVMNEAGLDPGIDHMLAMECIDRIHEFGGKVKSFVSFAGGLPSPEASDNALRYKFSWSPRGMLLALMNPSKHILRGELVELEGGGAVVDHLYPIDFMPGFSLVGHANRDSTTYAEIYGVKEECLTLLRGTLRYKGFAEAIRALRTVGYMSLEKKDFLNPMLGPDLTWKQIMAALMNQEYDIFPDSLRNIVAEKLGKEQKHELEALEQLGLFAETTAERHSTPLETLIPHFAKALAYLPGERDVAILNHDIEAQLPSGSVERHRISLVAYGDPNGYSAMARTVGYTAAIMSHMILEGEIQRKGMLRPVFKDVYRPVLRRLQDFGIKATTKVTPVE